ncbi:copper resistance CopC family protein [Corynebacterium fournieri]|uniref:copper resistance CopC family protein n=1 Tax=Corynebacterium fournieri TaxID=1852390 RepID=UPI000A2F0043|nr:copper resistance protein CopC [Corynebacterium fournieri]WJY97708.1 hypothetical protein CFOUR_06460 [Corynebacterium fournieri]
MHIATTARRGGVVAAIAATTVLSAAPALAHDSVIGSNPEDGAVISQFPDTVLLEFSGEVQDGFSTVAISREADGSADVIYSGEPEIDGRNVTLDLPADLAPEAGDYKVGYQIVSSDGHATKGMTSFTFDPAGESEAATAQEKSQEKSEQKGAAEEAEKTSENETDSSSLLKTFLIAFVVALGVIVAGRALMKRSKQNEPDTSRDEK